MTEVSYESWKPTVENTEDIVASSAAVRLHNLLDAPGSPPRAGDPVPPLWHWLGFLPQDPHHNLGPDGHPQRGSFHPPVELPRRMFVGGRVEFLAPLLIGEPVVRSAIVTDVASKEGSTGRLIFETVRIELTGSNGLAVVEEQDFVYRDISTSSPQGETVKEPVSEEEFGLDLAIESTLLFRFSALTYNAHKIHYDREWAVNEERYPGLVVHGPLQAIGLLELPRRFLPQETLKRFEFRAIQPAFDNGPLRLRGSLEGPLLRLNAFNGTGQRSTKATATLAQ